MKKIFILNRNRKKRIHNILLLLFPDYNIIRIKKSGEIIMKKKWFYLTSYKGSLIELCLNEIPKQLSIYRKDSNYYEKFKNILNILISQESIHIADFLISEFQKIKINNISLITNDESSSITSIRSILNQTKKLSNNSIKNRTKETISMLNKMNPLKESYSLCLG